MPNKAGMIFIKTSSTKRNLIKFKIYNFVLRDTLTIHYQDRHWRDMKNPEIARENIIKVC